MKITTACFPFFVALAAFSQVQGPQNPASAMNTSCPFSFSSPTDYLPANNVFSSDNQYATASHCDCCDMNTRCLETKAYGFSIPLTATIDGIVVEVEKKALPVNSNVQDNGVMLMKAGNTVGNNYATVTTWPTSDAYSAYGGPNDLWGTTWTPADINDPNFGLAFASISYTCFGNNTPVTSYIDHIRITVYYTNIATGIREWMMSGHSGNFTLINSLGQVINAKDALNPGAYILIYENGFSQKLIILEK